MDEKRLFREIGSNDVTPNNETSMKYNFIWKILFHIAKIAPSYILIKLHGQKYEIHLLI